jgi:hypothetical protein
VAAESDLDRFCDFSERFLTDEAGRPLVIEPFQRRLRLTSRPSPWA